MIYSLSPKFHPELTFDEANIITFNIYGKKGEPFLSLEAFIARLDTLQQNTTDPYLCRSIQSIQDKVSILTQAEYKQLCIDCAAGKLIFPPNYRIPSINPHDE